MDHHREQEQESNQDNRLNHIRKSKNRARIIGTRIVLQQGVHRDQEQSSKQAGQRIEHHKCHRMHKERNQEHAHRHTDHTHRNKTGLDKVPRLGRRNDRAYHKARNCKGQVILNHVDVIRARHILVHKHKHLSQGPEHGKSNNGRTQSRNTPTKTQVLFHILNIDIRIFILDLGDHETSHGTKYTNTRQNPGNHKRFRRNAMDRRIRLQRFQINQIHTHDGKPRRANDATQAKNLQERIRKAQVTDSEHFFKDAILGCTMNRKTAAKSNRQPECHTRAIACYKHRLGYYKRSHKQSRPREHLIL